MNTNISIRLVALGERYGEAEVSSIPEPEIAQRLEMLLGWAITCLVSPTQQLRDLLPDRTFHRSGISKPSRWACRWAAQLTCVASV